LAVSSKSHIADRRLSVDKFLFVCHLWDVITCHSCNIRRSWAQIIQLYYIRCWVSAGSI